MPLQPTYPFEDIQKDNLRLKSPNDKFWPPLPQLLQWSMQNKEKCNESGQWLLYRLKNKKGSIAKNMKLDLGAIQQNKNACERTEVQQKREKLAYFDKECSQIIDHIFLGSESVARNKKTLHDNGITNILNCVGFNCPEYFYKDFGYKTLWLEDSPLEDITSILYDVFDYFEEVREEGGRVFVHCCQGVSRSTSLVIAYLMWIDKYTFEDAFLHVKNARGVTNPNMGFACQLLQCQKRVHAMPISPKSILRMYRIAPHSLYDPMHLVPKIVQNSHLHALDSRGAFVVLIPNTFFIWQGSKCDTDMTFSAHCFVYQVIQYEKAKGKILHIEEGKEPREFWNIFQKNEIYINKFQNSTSEASKNDEKKSTFSLIPNVSVKYVSLYDRDFETFMIAKCNKSIPINLEKKLNATILGQRDSGWTYLQRRYIHELEKITLGKHKDFDIITTLEEIVTIPNVEMEFKNDYNSTHSQSISSSSLDTSPKSSSSSLSFHSILSHPSQSPCAMTSPCLSSPPSPTPIISPSNASKSSYKSTQAVFNVCNSISNPSSPPLKNNINNIFKESFTQKSLVFTTSNAFEDHNISIDYSQRTCDDNSSCSLKENSHIYTISNDLNTPNNNDNTNDTSDDIDILTNSLEQTFTKSLEQTSRNYVKDERLATSSEACCSFQEDKKNKSSSSRSSSSRSRTTQMTQNDAPVLFEWPQMEKIEMFDADDLDSKTAFVLLVSKKFHKSQYCLYFWVGSSLQIKNDENSKLFNGDIQEHCIEHWQNVGKHVIDQLNLQEHVHVEVIFDGKEPSEFWDYFING